MSLYYIGSFLIPFVVSLILIPLIKRLSSKLNFVDLPSGRKIHTRPVPLGGGIALFIGFVIVLISLVSLFGYSGSRPAIGITVGLVLVFLIGFYDDIFNMQAMPKLIGQLVASVIFLNFIDTVPPIISLPAYLLFSALWIVGLQNAFNFLDNMDGLCGGISMLIAIGLGALFVLKGMTVFALMSFALAGGALGFLRYNLPPASIFLGDTGSLLLGFALSSLALVHINSSKDLNAALAPLVIMAYPIFDLVFVTVSRLNEGRRVYIGGRDHSAHKITFMGLTRRSTILVLYFINLLLIVVGILVFFMEESSFQVLILIILAFILAFAGTHLYKNIRYIWQRAVFLITDLISINLAMFLYYYIKFGSEFHRSLAAFSLIDIIIPLAWINIFWLLIFAAGGLYDIPIEVKPKYRFRAIIKAVISGAVFFLILNLSVGRDMRISLFSMALYIGLLSLIIFVLHQLLTDAINFLSHKTGQKQNALVVHLGNEDPERARLADLHRLYDIKGVVGQPLKYEIPFLGSVDDLHDLLRRFKATRIIMSVSNDYTGSLAPVFASAYFMETRFIAGESLGRNFRGFKKQSTRHEGIDVLMISHRPLFGRMIRRILESIITGTIVLLTLPWIIYRWSQARMRKQHLTGEMAIIGFNESQREVRILRDAKGIAAMRNPIGLLAVLKGDIALVGATITTPDDLDPALCLPGYWRKFAAKPGLFGPGYWATCSEERLQFDLNYIEKSSIFYDLSVLLRQWLKITPVKESISANA